MTAGFARPRRALVTGASAGLGAALCIELARRGWLVIGASRRGTVPAAGKSSKGTIEGRRLDVTDAAAVEALVEELDAAGGIDLYVLNAGINTPQPVEELPLKRAREIMETNFWGVVTLARAAVPGLRARGGGTIAVIGSLAGKITPPGEAIYAASKHALEGWCEGLLHEVGRFGIHIRLLAPGFITTTQVPAKPPPQAAESPYGDLTRRLVIGWQKHAREGMVPKVAARRIIRALRHGTGPWRIPIGAGATWLPRLRFLIGDRLFLPITRRLFGLSPDLPSSSTAGRPQKQS